LAASSSTLTASGRGCAAAAMVTVAVVRQSRCPHAPPAW
jgi:hypothetical protein